MTRRVPIVVLVVLLATLCNAAVGLAQDGRLATLIPTLYGSEGLFVDSEAPLPDGSTHSAHFNSDFQAQFTQFNIALSTQISALPLPSPASGFTYSFDPALGVVKRSTESFGPILSERAETIGKKRYAFGISYQYFSFDQLEGVDLDAVPAVFSHDSPAPGGRADVVTTRNSIRASIGQLTAFLTFGVTDRLDVSLAVPLVTTDLEVVSDATIRRLGTGDNRAVHFFRDEQGAIGDHRRFARSGSASGLGDLTLRLKGTAYEKGSAGLAVGVDVRLPTGDEEDLLGTGAAGVKPFLAYSFSYKKISPHVNLGYQWNGDSVLAGDVLAGEKGSLPDQWLYAVGFDVGVSPKLTLAFDILGRRVIDSPRLVRRTFVGLDAAGTEIPDIAFEQGRSFNELNGALGLKVHLRGDFLLDLNLLLSLDDSGLRDDLTPLVGLEYSF